MTKKLLAISFLFLFLCYLIPHVQATSYTYVLNGATHTVNETLGYKLSTVNSTVFVNDQTSTSGNYNVSHGIRVWTVNTKGNLTEITSGSPVAVVTRVNNGSGYESTTWNCPQSNNSVFDALLVRVYRRYGVATWTLRVSFITLQLNARLTNSTWVVYYNTYRNFLAGSTMGSCRWGNSTHYSRIENIELTSYTTWEWMNSYLQQGNFAAFLLAPYVNLLGELAYGLIVLIPAITIYNRTDGNITYVAAVFILFGGATGIFTLLIPTAALNLAYILLVVGVAILFTKLILTTKQH